MAGLTEIREIWTPRMLSLFRIVVALLYLQHPMAKFFAFPHLAAFDNLQPFSLIWVAGVIELIGGLLLLIACSHGQPPSSCRVKWQ
jgi:putative oxidoreductase